MVCRFDELPSTLLGFEEGLEWDGGLVVRDVEGWPVPFIFKLFEDLFKCCYNGGVCESLEREGEDKVGVIVVGDEEVLVAVEREGGEGACAICVDCAPLFVGEGSVHEDIACVCAVGGCDAQGGREVWVFVAVTWGGSCAAYADAWSFHTSFGRRWGRSKMALDVQGGHEWPVGEVAVLYGSEECRNGWAKQGLVHVFKLVLSMSDGVDGVC